MFQESTVREVWEVKKNKEEGMEEEIVLVTSNKDNGGISFINITTGSIYSQNMKNCLCPPQGKLLLSLSFSSSFFIFLFLLNL